MTESRRSQIARPAAATRRPWVELEALLRTSLTPWFGEAHMQPKQFQEVLALKEDMAAVALVVKLWQSWRFGS